MVDQLFTFQRLSKTLVLSLSCLVRCLLFCYSDFTSKGGVSLLDNEDDDDDDDDYNFYLHPRVFLLILQREEWREREREISMWERNIDQLSPIWDQTRDPTCDLSLCPDQESNPQSYGMDGTPTNPATWPGLIIIILFNILKIKKFSAHVSYWFYHS